MVRTMGGDKSMAYPLAQHSSQIIQPLTKYQRHHATTISNFSSKLEPNKQNLFLPLWQIHHSTNCFFFLGPWTKFTHAVELLCTLWGKQKEKEKRWATHLTMVIKLLRYQPGAKDPIRPTAPNITLYKVIWFYTTLHPWWISGSIIDFIAVIAFSYPQQFVSFPFQHINRGITLKKFLLPWTKMKEMTNHVHRWANWARANSKRYKGNC